MNRADLVWSLVYAGCVMRDLNTFKGCGYSMERIAQNGDAIRSHAEAMADMAVEEMEERE